MDDHNHQMWENDEYFRTLEGRVEDTNRLMNLLEADAHHYLYIYYDAWGDFIWEFEYPGGYCEIENVGEDIEKLMEELEDVYDLEEFREQMRMLAFADYAV